MTDFQTFAVNLAIAVLKIQAGQRYGDEQDLLNMITSLREVPSSSRYDEIEVLFLLLVEKGAKT